MTEAQYYKLRFDLQEVMITQERAQQILKNCAIRQVDVFKANGLDPTKTYQFDDETFTLHEKVSPTINREKE